MIDSSLSVAPLWLWPAFIFGVIALLIFDLSMNAKEEVRSRKTAILESVLWIVLALCFNLFIYIDFGKDLAVEFLTGYLVEKSLSIDNLFVILLIFKSFRIPTKLQHRVLFYGILGAIVFRAIFILVGAKLVHEFEWIFYIFGAILVYTAIQFLRGSDEEMDTRGHWSIRWVKKFYPVSEKLDGPHFFVVEEGIKKASPLFLALIIIEATDIVFAVDSIPAVFAVTKDAFIAFSSNILAILGLRALYFVLVDWVSQLRYLKPGLSCILGFIGLKMLAVDFIKIPSWVSLLVIVGVLSTAALSSWYANKVSKI